jgi:hypothetical protein
MTQAIRKCSYCYGEKHTITSCDIRKTQLAKAEKMNAQARKEIVELIDKIGLYVGSLIELKYRDFSTIANITEPEIGAEVGLFYVKEIRWIAINKTLIDNSIPRKLKEYLQSRSAIRSNYSNIILVNADYPNGFSLTITTDKLKQMLAQQEPFSKEYNVIGDFCVHDPGIKEKTLESIPKNFFEGKFYNAHKRLIK